MHITIVAEGSHMDRRACTTILFFAAVLSVHADTPSQKIPPVIIRAASTTHYSLSGVPDIRITREQMRAAGVSSLNQALQTLGGVQLQDLAGNGSQVLVNMRGFGANAVSNTLLLVNGIPLSNPDLAPPDLNAIPLREIEYIEIIAGSESVLYGDQAVAGTVNIVTKPRENERAALSCAGGSYNLHNCYLIFNQPHKPVNLNLSLNNYHSDNYRDRNDDDQNHLTGSAGYTYPYGELNLNYSLGNEDMQYPGALSGAQVRQDRRQSSNETDFFNNWNGAIHLNHRQEISGDWHITTDLAHRIMQGHGVLFAPFTQSRSAYYFRPKLSGTFHDALLNAGIDAQDDRYQLNSSLGLTGDTQQKYGVFALAKISLCQRWTLSIGARAAQQNSRLRSFILDNYVNRAEASTIGAAYQITPDSSFYLRRAESFRFPKADENASALTAPHGLRTQRGASYETGVEITRENYSAKIGLYQLNLRDEIAFDPTQTPLTPFGSNRNLDPTVRRGLSISGKDRILGKLTLDGQYNYVDAVFASGMNRGNRIPLVSDNLLRAGMDYKIDGHWNAYLEAVFTGDQYADNDDANIAGKLGGYTVCNFNIRYAYQSFSAAFRVNNVFNRYYYLYTVYQPVLNSEFFYPAPDRNIMLEMNYVFA